MGLTKTAIQRPVFIFMLMAAAILMGFMGWNSMRKELNPDVSFGVITVSTVYPGAGPEEINTLISRRIEEAVTGIANIKEVVATSQEGVSNVTISFEVGTDINVALAEVRSRVDSIITLLPDAALKPEISKFDTSADPVMILSVNSDTMNAQELRELAENDLKDELSRIKGVASVNVSGGELREIQVQLDKNDLVRYGVGIVDIQRAIQAATVNIPAGRIETNGQELGVRVLGEFDSLDELSNMFITIRNPNQPGPGKTIRLSDIATVVDTTAERETFSRLDGKDAVVMTVLKAKEGNAVEISDGISVTKTNGKTLLESLEEQHGVNFVVSLNTADQISESLADLLIALVFGILLVGVVIFVFLHNFRGTLIVAIAIPICLFATLIAYWCFGFTLNNMSMLALSLAIGVLVDDAIVVIENIYRHLTMGEDPVDAAVNGRAEIGLAAIAITLADVVVFLPVAFMGGIVGQFFRPLGIGYAVAVLVSLFVSFTVTPMLASRWYRKGENWEHPQGRFAKWFENGFHRFADFYRKVLRFSLNHRWYFFGGGFAALVGVILFIGGSFAPTPGAAVGSAAMLAVVSFVIAALIFLGNLIFRRKFAFKVFLGAICFSLFFALAGFTGHQYAKWKQEAVFKFAFFPPSDSGIVNINIELPPGASLDETAKVATQIEQIAIEHPLSHYVTTQVGRRSGGFGPSFQGSQFAQITVTMLEKESILDKITFKKHDEEMRSLSTSAEQMAAELLRQIGHVPGAKVTVTGSSDVGFGSPIQLAFKGDNRQQLAETAKAVKDRLANGAIEGVINADVSSKPGKPELRAIPDRARMANAGLTTAEIGQALRTLYEGDDFTKYREGGEEYDIRVMMDLEDRNNPDILGSVPVSFDQGNPIFLNEVATIKEGQSIDKIDRRDRQEVVTVTADLLTGYAAGSVQAQIDSWLKEENLIPEGVSYRPLGQADVQNNEMGFLFGALFLGVILVYMVLAALFNNMLYPFIVQLAQPQAMVGALLALIIFDKTLNIVGFIGIIALVGLVGKNAILLVDYTNTLRSRGMEKYDALVESGGTRIRPILMTTIALVVGMLPVALAIGRGSEFRETIGITIIGGAVVSTFLTLLVIPCSYSIFDDLSNAFSRRKAKKQQAELSSE